MRLFVTGASGGLGSVLSSLALERGHEVYASARSMERLRVCLAEEKLRYGEKFTLCPLDVTSPEQTAAVARRIEKNGAFLDGLVNCAAIMIEREKTIDTLDLEKVEESFRVNTIGPMRTVQQFLPFLRRGTRPVIVNVSSEAGTIINAFPTNYAYSISKTALNMFSERLRESERKNGILVYAVHPGWMRTNMGGCDAPADPRDIAGGILDILERKKEIYSKIAFIDATGRPMPL